MFQLNSQNGSLYSYTLPRDLGFSSVRLPYHSSQVGLRSIGLLLIGLIISVQLGTVCSGSDAMLNSTLEINTSALYVLSFDNAYHRWC